MAETSDLPTSSSERNALTILAITSAFLAALLVFTHLQYVLLAIVLAYVLTPAQRTLERRMGSKTAAITLIVCSILVVFIPLAYILAIAIQQGFELLTAIQEGGFRPEVIQTRLETIGYVVNFELLYATYKEPIAAGLQGLATGTLTVIGGLPGVLIGFTVTAFVLFVLLRDSERLVAWLQSVVPINDRVQRELLEELDHLMWASVVGNVAVAGIQAVLLGIGLVLVGMPGVVFLTVATFILTLLPLVGTFGVWLPVSSYLFVIGRPLAAGLFLLYGLLVSVSDVYLRPALISRSGTINVAIIVVGIFGGVVLLGAIGLFLGPVLLGGAKIVLDLFAKERAKPTSV
ncbi:MAG: AI-2E family transporter [Halobacteriota archaeon]